MNTYRVHDIRDGFLAPDKMIKAHSPMEAVMYAGYVDFERDYSGRSGSILVTGPRGRYVYFGRKRIQMNGYQKIKVYPSIGEAFYVMVPDSVEDIDEFLEDHLINVEEWDTAEDLERRNKNGTALAMG